MREQGGWREEEIGVGGRKRGMEWYGNDNKIKRSVKEGCKGKVGCGGEGGTEVREWVWR